MPVRVSGESRVVGRTFLLSSTRLSVCPPVQLTLYLCSERIIRVELLGRAVCGIKSGQAVASCLVGGEVRMEQVRIQQKKNPRDEAGFLSIVFFWWMNPLLALGYNRDLELEDLYGPRKEDQSEVGGSDQDKI